MKSVLEPCKESFHYKSCPDALISSPCVDKSPVSGNRVPIEMSPVSSMFSGSTIPPRVIVGGK